MGSVIFSLCQEDQIAVNDEIRNTVEHHDILDACLLGIHCHAAAVIPQIQQMHLSKMFRKEGCQRGGIGIPHQQNYSCALRVFNHAQGLISTQKCRVFVFDRQIRAVIQSARLRFSGAPVCHSQTVLFHPKLHIVRHEDYIPEEYLPTFNSHPIELNFHRIPNLAEHFVYFNDDTFLTAPVEPEDFFVNGIPCDSVSESPIPCDNQGIWSHILVNNVMFLNRHFSKKEVKKQHYKKWYSFKSPKDMMKNMILSTIKRDAFFGLSTHHIHQAYLKSSFEQVWNMEPELLDHTCRSRFRSQEDINHFIIREYQLLKGDFHIKNIYKMGHAFHDNISFQVAADALKHQQYKVVCLNDTDQIHFNDAKELIHNGFQAILPERSSFEQF